MQLVQKLSAAAIAAALIGSAAPAAAVTVEFRNITGTWLNVIGQTGAANISTSGDGTANTQVRWGQGGNRSGYNFGAIGDLTLALTPPDSSAVTSIAEFAHVNQPINSGSSILSAQLEFTTAVFVNDVFLRNVMFLYDFEHDETPNGDEPCRYGGENDQGVNINGCADRVMTNFNSQSEFFTIDNVDYALDVVGFLVDGNEVTNFLTRESADNSAFILGRIVPYSIAVGPAVPEPSTWAMLIAGFGLVGAARRQQRRVITA